jgi:hypothetical protein
VQGQGGTAKRKISQRVRRAPSGHLSDLQWPPINYKLMPLTLNKRSCRQRIDWLVGSVGTLDEPLRPAAAVTGCKEGDPTCQHRMGQAEEQGEEQTPDHPGEFRCPRNLWVSLGRMTGKNRGNR